MDSSLQINELLRLVGQGDRQARDELLQRHRKSLARMIAAHLDPRVAPRIDDSDILQDALIRADQRLDQYVLDRPIPFYPWLRQIVREQIIEVHRKHLHAQRRSVYREQPNQLQPTDDSISAFVTAFPADDSTPSVRASRAETRNMVRSALSRLSESDRQVLTMRYVEQMKIAELAELLEITEAAAKSRVRRALEKLDREIEQFDLS